MLSNLFQAAKEGFSRQGSFVRNISIFVSGSLLAFLIGFIFTPVITRIYTPEDYGRFAFFNTVLAILYSVSTLNYSEALMLPKKSKDFFSLSRLILIISTLFSAFFFIFILFFGNSFLVYFNVQGLDNLMFFIPLLLVLSILQLLADNYNLRKKKFTESSKSKIVSVLFAKGTVTAIGLKFGSSVSGLLSGEIIVRIINYITLLGKNAIRLPWKLIRGLNRRELVEIGRTYKKYPLFIFPASILLQMAVHIPVFIIGNQFSAEMLGYYSLAITLLGIPVQIIGVSIGKVFLQKATEMVHLNKLEELHKLIILLFYFSLALSVFGYSGIYFFGEQIFVLVAGEKWSLAGKVATLLSPGLAYQLISTVLTPCFRILKLEKEKLLSEIIGSVILIVGIFLVTKLKIDYFLLIAVFSLLFFTKHSISIGFLLLKMGNRVFIHLVLPTLILIAVYIITIGFMFDI